MFYFSSAFIETNSTSKIRTAFGPIGPPGVQGSGSSNRSHQSVNEVTVPIASGQESFTGAVSMGLARDLNVSARYSDSYRGQPGQAREWSVDLVKRFGT